jgi:hypothetical protein
MFNIKSRFDEYLWDQQQAKPNNKIISIEDMIGLLELKVHDLITGIDVDGSKIHPHIFTKSHSESAHFLLTQKTAALAYFNLYELKKDKKYLKLGLNIADYITTHQEENGLFLMHNHPLLSQDEGPTTAGVIKALVFAYKLTKKKKYLDIAKTAAIASRKIIYSKKYGYIHTLGQDYWCTNINSSFAYSYILLFEETGDDKYLKWSSDGIKFTLRGQVDSGLFLYSAKFRHVFRALYQALVLLTLMEYNEFEHDKKIEHAIQKGIKYAYTLQRDDGSIKESQMNCYSFLQSCTRFAHLFKLLNDQKRYEKLLKYTSKFFTPNTIYLEHAKSGVVRFGFRKRYIEANYVRMLEDLVNVILNKKHHY